MTDTDLNGIQKIVDQLSYKDWVFFIGNSGGTSNPQLYLQVRFHTKDSVDQRPYLASGRKWKISFHMTKGEIVRTALKAVLAAEEHEARENFKYRGRAVFNPHIDIDVLHRICEETEKRQTTHD